jgi:opacity protein-like surface antigen
LVRGGWRWRRLQLLVGVRRRQNERSGRSSADRFGQPAGRHRLLSWLAFEALYEGAYSYDIVVAGATVSSLSTHGLVANTKLIVPTWRLQPYLGLGVGAQYGNFDGDGSLDQLDTSRWDLVLRIGLGLDSYLSEHWIVNLELAPSVRFADYGNIPSESTDNFSLTLSAGIQYRF